MRILRRALQVVLLLATIAVGAAALAIIVSQTAWFRDWLRGVVVRQANQYLNGTLAIGRLGGNLFFGIELADLGVLQNGERVVAVRNLGVDYSVWRFIAGDVAIDHIRLDQPRILLRREAGKWNLSALVKPQRREKDREGPGRPVTIGEIGISDGRIVIDRGRPDAPEVGTAGAAEADATPTSIERLDARLSFAYEPVHYSVEIAHLSFRTISPALALNALSGKVAVRDDTLWLDGVAVKTAESSVKIHGQVAQYLSQPNLALEAASDKFSLPEVGRLVPALAGIPLQPSFRVSAHGPLDRASLDFAVKSSAGDASGRVRADLEGPDRGLAGTVHVANLDLAPIAKAPGAASPITGDADLDLRFPGGRGRGPVTGTFSARASQASIAGFAARDIVAGGRVEARNRVTLAHATARAYGASASAAGTIQPGVAGPDGRSGVALDLHGAVSGLDLRRLPRRLRVPAVESRLTFEYRVAGVGAQVEGDAKLQTSTFAGATLGEGMTASFSNTGPEIRYAAEGEVERLDLRRVGEQFQIEALAAPRFESAIAGRFTAAGSGTALDTLRLDANATLSSSTLSGVRMPAMDVEAHIADGGGRFRAAGSFEELDPAKLTGQDRLRGRLGGRLDAEVTLADLNRVSPEHVSGSGSLSLSPSSIGDLSIERADVAGRYTASTAHVTRLDIAGPDLKLNGRGTLALGEEGTSDLAYHFESPKLAMIGRLAGQPLVGALALDGAVSGNRRSLRTTGTLKGSDLGYKDNRALGVDGRYDVRVPDLDASAVEIGADLSARFVKLGAQEINALQVKGNYAGRQQALRFDATARSAPREARLSGTLLLHTDHQEVHLTQFGFRTQGIEWVLPEGREPVIQYAGGRVEVKGLRLVSGPQAINAEGVIDRAESNLRASLTDVDLSRLDTWLAGDRRLGGILNAGVHVTGPSASLLVNGDFSIDNGAFREFRYETLGGTVNYTGGRVALDVRLFQGPQAWISARGTVPTALWSEPKEGSGTADGAAAAETPVDLTIDSSPIDLGLVQGFTGAITKASGVLEAHVRVSGSARDPQMSGGVGITNGAFTVASTGVAYTGLNGRIDLQPGRAVFNGVQVADSHRKTLTIGGDVSLEQKALGNLALAIKSRDFEVLDNDLGRVSLDTDVKVGGRVAAPRIEGTVSVGSGEINIDRVLELASSSAYATTPQAGATPGGLTETAADPAMPAPAGRDAVPVPAAASVVGTVPTLPVGGGAASPAQAAPAAAKTEPFNAMMLNVRLHVPPSLVVKGKDLRPGGGAIGLGDVNVTLGGDVRMEKAPAGPLRLLGQVTTVRGTYDFQGRRFDIQRDGRVRFEGGLPLDPALDITATRLISGVEARVHVGGTSRRPELTLTSRPPLDQADILALIVFNQPANQLGEGQQASLAERAGALATGFVASKLADSIGSALNLDTFEIQTAPESSGGQGALVTVGEQLGQRLFVKLTQGVGSENLSQFVIDYQFTDIVRLSTTITQGESVTRSLVRRVERSGVDLIFFFSY